MKEKRQVNLKYVEAKETHSYLGEALASGVELLK
jgi:hypothetical protein